MDYEAITIFIFPLVMIILSFRYKEKSKRDISEYSEIKDKPNRQIRENWKLVNNYASKLLLRTGIILTILSLIITLRSKINISNITNILFFQILVYVIIFLIVENKLKKNLK